MADLLAEFEHLQQEAANEKTSSNEHGRGTDYNHLSQSVTDSTEKARQLAQAPSTSPELLRKLASSKDASTRLYVVANPNTPTNVLWKLGVQFPKQLLDNPIFSLLLLENPNLVKVIPLPTLQSLVKQENVPISVLQGAATQINQEIQLAVAMKAQTPKATLEKLVKSRSSQVSEAAQLHINWAGEMKEASDQAIKEAIATTSLYQEYENYLELLAKLGAIPEFVLQHLPKNIAFLQELANNSNTPDKTLEFLARDKNWEIRLGVASNPNTTGKILEELAKDNNSWIREEVCRNSNTPTIVLKQLAKSTAQSDKESEFLTELAEIAVITEQEVNSNFKATEERLEKLPEDKHWKRRLEVAKNPNTSVKILEKLAKDRDLWVRLEVATNPRTPARILKELVEDDYDQVRQSLPTNSNPPVSLLTLLLACEAEYWIALEVVKNPNTPVELLKQLARRNDCLICREVAANPNTPVFLLAQLAHSEDSKVRQNIASNPNTPVSILERWVKDNSESIRVAIATHPNTPVRLLEQLLCDRSPSVLQFAVVRYLAHHPDKLSVVLNHYPKYSTPSLSRFVILLHPDVPINWLTENCNSSAWLERYAIAQHPNTPLDTLHTLAKDANRIVRAAARANLQHRQ
ncbi:MAG: hypothetical protein AB1589_02720 [Cyanobacteriota bacterium]